MVFCIFIPVLAAGILLLAACVPGEFFLKTPDTQPAEEPDPNESGDPGENEDAGKPDPDESDEPGEDVDPGEGDEPDPNDGDDPGNGENTLLLFADAGGGSAYGLIRAAGFDYETPDQAMGGHEGVTHIVQQFDASLQKNVFAFVTHHNVDRNVTGDWTRQRVEIKIDHRQGSHGRDFCGLGGPDEGRAFIYRWKFKLPADFNPSTSFTHIHQIKNEGGDATQPIISLTARLTGSNRRMQLIYRAPTFRYGEAAPESSPSRYLAGNSGNSLDAFLGEWVQAEEYIAYSGDPGQAAYSIKITRIRDKAVLLDYTHSPARYAQLESDAGKWPFATWRGGNTHGRPKFGLYRLIFSGSSPGNYIEPLSGNLISGLKDETVLYADFEVKRIH